ncbi:hypothetical protein SNEBB_000446 [Seison nebaliae]|nr:hypothetical protein SNEBB_000446 [Seison nebaliae]
MDALKPIAFNNDLFDRRKKKRKSQRLRCIGLLLSLIIVGGISIALGVSSSATSGPFAVILKTFDIFFSIAITGNELYCDEMTQNFFTRIFSLKIIAINELKCYIIKGQVSNNRRKRQTTTDVCPVTTQYVDDGSGDVNVLVMRFQGDVGDTNNIGSIEAAASAGEYETLKNTMSNIIRNEEDEIVKYFNPYYMNVDQFTLNRFNEFQSNPITVTSQYETADRKVQIIKIDRIINGQSIDSCNAAFADILQYYRDLFNDDDLIIYDTNERCIQLTNSTFCLSTNIVIMVTDDERDTYSDKKDDHVDQITTIIGYHELIYLFFPLTAKLMGKLSIIHNYYSIPKICTNHSNQFNYRLFLLNKRKFLNFS